MVCILGSRLYAGGSRGYETLTFLVQLDDFVTHPELRQQMLDPLAVATVSFAAQEALGQ